MAFYGVTILLPSPSSPQSCRFAVVVSSHGCILVRVVCVKCINVRVKKCKNRNFFHFPRCLCLTALPYSDSGCEARRTSDRQETECQFPTIKAQAETYSHYVVDWLVSSCTGVTETSPVRLHSLTRIRSFFPPSPFNFFSSRYRRIKNFMEFFMDFCITRIISRSLPQ